MDRMDRMDPYARNRNMFLLLPLQYVRTVLVCTLYVREHEVEREKGILMLGYPQCTCPAS